MEKMVQGFVIPQEFLVNGKTLIFKNKQTLNREQAYHAVAHIEEARRDLSRHINTNYTIKNLILKLIQEEPT